MTALVDTLLGGVFHAAVLFLVAAGLQLVFGVQKIVNLACGSFYTLGTALGTIGGALVVPSSAASLEMAVELVVEAFAVVVIGGLGSMRGALAGALAVGLMRAAAISVMPEVEMLSIYLVVVVVLLLRPAGLFGKAAI